MHWSVLAIVVLVVAGLSAHLPRIVPGYPWGLPAGRGGGRSAVRGSLLAHEMVDGITLWLLGGIAQLRGEAPRPVLIPYFCDRSGHQPGGGRRVRRGGLAGRAGRPQRSGGSGAKLFGRDQCGVGHIQHDPGGAPGRRADLARRGMGMARCRFSATVLAAQAGRIFGLSLIALGLLLAIGGISGGLWWMLLGLFIVTMASAEEHHARTSTALAGIRVRDVI